MITWAIAQAIERSFATPRIKPFLPSNMPIAATPTREPWHRGQSLPIFGNCSRRVCVAVQQQNLDFFTDRKQPITGGKERQNGRIGERPQIVGALPRQRRDVMDAVDQL